MSSSKGRRKKMGFVTELTFLISAQSLCVLFLFLTSTTGLPHGSQILQLCQCQEGGLRNVSRVLKNRGFGLGRFSHKTAVSVLV